MKKYRAQDRITDDLRRQIVSRELPAGNHLLPEPKLAEKYGVSTRVARESLARLEAEGLISREQGRGTFVLPLPAAQASRKQKNIAVIFIGRIRDTSTMEYFESLQMTFQSCGYGTTFFSSDNDPEKEDALVQQLVQDGFPGVVLFSAHCSNSYAHLKAAQEAGTQIALIDHYFPGFQCNYVGVADCDAAFEATSHLLKLGCEELVYLHSDHEWTGVANRLKGFKEAMAKQGSRVRGHVVNVRPFEDISSQLRAHLPALAKKARGKMGVVAFNDRTALSAIGCLQESGLVVPDDVAVIGFADDLEGAIDDVALTTMHFPRGEIARLAAYLLMQQIDNPDHEPQRVELAANLTIRSSCGCYSVTKPDALMGSLNKT